MNYKQNRTTEADMPLLTEVFIGFDDETPPDSSYKKINMDCNKGAGGVYVWVYFKRALTDNPITDICFVTGDSKDISAPDGYSKIDKDLNAGAGGKYIFLCYTRQGKNLPIVSLSAISDNNSSVRPASNTRYLRINQDLNQGANGDYIYLCYLPYYAAEFKITNELPHWAATARYHKGDENGDSTMSFAMPTLSDNVKALGYDVWLDLNEEVTLQESGKNTKTDELKVRDGVVVTGRRHVGDENGNTTYTLARVMVRKQLSEGDYCDLPCRTKDTKEIESKHESNANLISMPGYAIVGRKHSGDENGSTNTTFGRFYFEDIMDGRTATYDLIFKGSYQSEKRKESESDFYVDTFDHKNIFTPYCARTSISSRLDHTWVNPNTKKNDEPDFFVCRGGHAKDVKFGDFPVGEEAYAVMDSIRNMDFDRSKENSGSSSGGEDWIGVRYLVDGVCHQMANRFLQPTGKTISESGGRPKGYGVSCTAYGKHGSFYSQWLEQVYKPAASGKKVESAFASVYDEEAETDLLIRETADRMGHLFSDYPKDQVARAQRKWMAVKTQLLWKYGMLTEKNESVHPRALEVETITAMVKDFNEAIDTLQKEIRLALGVEKFKVFNGGEDIIYTLIDLDIAKDFYGSR